MIDSPFCPAFALLRAYKLDGDFGVSLHQENWPNGVVRVAFESTPEIGYYATKIPGKLLNGLD